MSLHEDALARLWRTPSRVKSSCVQRVFNRVAVTLHNMSVEYVGMATPFHVWWMLLYHATEKQFLYFSFMYFFSSRLRLLLIMRETSGRHRGTKAALGGWI